MSETTPRVVMAGPWRVTLHQPVRVYRGALDEHITRPNFCRWGDTLGCIMQTTFDSHGTHRDNRHIAVSNDNGASWQIVAKNVDVGSFSLFSKPDGEVVTLPHDSTRFGPDHCSMGGTRAIITNHDGTLQIAHTPLMARMPRALMGYWTDRPTSGEPDAVAPENKPIAYFWGTIVELRDGRWICPAYGCFEGDPRTPAGTVETAMEGLAKFTAFLLVSSDEGRTWEWLCTVATPNDVPLDASEGPDEQMFYELADRWRSIFRCAAMKVTKPLHYSDSFDGGKTWTKPVALQDIDGMIDPKGLIMPDGPTVLATGRKGSDIYLATGADTTFHKVDIVAHHNACLPDAPLDAITQWGLPWFFPNTGHTDVIQVAPNRILFTYDRVPHGWRWAHTGGYTEADEIYTVAVDIERA